MASITLHDGASFSSDSRAVIKRCPLCRKADGPIYVGFRLMSWVRCDCELIYKRTAPAEVATEAIYDDPSYFHAGAGTHAHSYDRKTRRRVGKARRQLLDALNHAAPGPVLDVGCSLGYVMKAAQGLGMEAVGVDVAACAVQACRDQGLSAETGSLESLPFAEKRFAIVTMKHVLEHTADPRAALHEAFRVLRPGGALFIAVPHADYYRAARRPARSRFYHPESAGGIEHFVYYTPSTLSRLLEVCGFEVVQIHRAAVHRRASLSVRAAQQATAPARKILGAVADRLGLRKEFTLVALRPG